MKALALVLCLTAGHAMACGTVRVGYPYHHAPPYYMGEGPSVPERPGASVELIVRILSAAGCKIEWSRLPLSRIRLALSDGSIDMAPVNGLPDMMEFGMIPRDKSGAHDPRRSFEVQTMVLVRAKDNIARDIDPVAYFKGRKIGMTHGAIFRDQLRQAGIAVDDGAANMERNVDKLLRGRIDGYAITLVNPTDIDASLLARYGKSIVRLEKPLRTSRTWFVASKAFYASHTEQVEAMWTWISVNGLATFSDLVRQYEAKKP